MSAISRWDGRFLDLAAHVAQWSKDPSTRVGAVIVNAQRQVLSLGYNGFPRGVQDVLSRLEDRAEKYRFTVHAEANALLNATGPVRGCTLYCSLCTCHECAKLIIQAGITRVVITAPAPEVAERWSDAWQIAVRMYDEAGVRRVEVIGG